MCARNEILPVGQLRKINRQKRLTKYFHLSIFHDSFLLFIYAFYSYTWFHFDTHKKLKKAHSKSVCPAFAFYKEWRPETAPYSSRRGNRAREEGTNKLLTYLYEFLLDSLVISWGLHSSGNTSFRLSCQRESKWEECNDFSFPATFFNLDPTIWPDSECGYGLKINFPVELRLKIWIFILKICHDGTCKFQFLSERSLIKTA